MNFIETEKLIDIIVLAAVYAFGLCGKWKEKGTGKFAVNTLFYGYFSCVLYFTLMPVIASLPFVLNHPYGPMNFEPFIDYFNGWGDTVRQIVLNVVMMVPFGFLLPIVKKQNLFSCLFWTFLFSLSIELLQPLLNARSSDVTDLITNTVGGLFGYLMYLILRPLINRALLEANTD